MKLISRTYWAHSGWLVALFLLLFSLAVVSSAYVVCERLRMTLIQHEQEWQLHRQERAAFAEYLRSKQRGPERRKWTTPRLWVR